jgi:hypothetical protein
MTFLGSIRTGPIPLPNWRGRDLWRYFFRVALLFTLLQVLARLALQVSFFRDSLNLSQALIAHFYGLRFDVRLACLAASVPLLSGSIPWIGRWLHPLTGSLFGPKARLAWFWPGLGAVITALWSFFIYADFGNMAYWQQRLNIGVLFLLQDLNTNGRVLWDSYPVIPLAIGTLVLVITSFTVIKRIAAKLAARIQTSNSFTSGSIKGAKAFLINLFLVTIVLFLIHGRWSQYPLRWSDLVRVGHPPAEQLAINPVQNVVDTLAYRKPQFDRQAAEAAYPIMAAWLGVSRKDSKQLDPEHSDPKQADPKQPDPKQPDPQKLDNKPLNYARTPIPRNEPIFPKEANIVLVILESFSGYKSSLHGNKLDPTPTLKQLADQGWWFSRFGSAHPLTARGVYSIITSRPDVMAGDTASRNQQAILHQSLITAWSNHQPYYFIGGSTSWANIRGLLTKSVPGVKIYEEENFKTPRTDVWGLSDRNMFFESIDLLNRHTLESKKPFFAVIQTAANHRPYTIPSDDSEFKVIDKPEAEVLAQGIGGGNAEYNAIRLMDHSVAKFMERARQSPWFDNTVFVFLGDHGTIGDVPSYMPAWMQAKDMATIHTPFILYAPKFLKPKQFDIFGQQADVLPTLLDMSGRSAELRGLGRSLIAERPGQAGLLYSSQVGGSQYGWFDGRYYAKLSDGGTSSKALEGADSASREAAILARVQLFDLSDPSKKQVNIAAEEPLQAKRLGFFLEAYYQTARYLLVNP